MKRAAFLLPLALLGGWIGCQAGGVTVAETNAILTSREVERDYSEFRTYVLSDQLIELCLTPDEVEERGDGGAGGAGGEGGSRPDFDSSVCTKGSDVLEDEIFAALEVGMEELGYEKLDSTKDADLALLVARVARDHWYFAPEYPICDEFIDACVEPQLGYKYLLPNETLALVLVDLKNKNETVWLAAIPKAFETGVSASSVENAISQVFYQSPYLEVEQ